MNESYYIFSEERKKEDIRQTVDCMGVDRLWHRPNGARSRRYKVWAEDDDRRARRRLKVKLKMQTEIDVRKVNFDIDVTLIQGCHVSGKSQGKTKFSPGQGIVREF